MSRRAHVLFTGPAMRRSNLRGHASRYRWAAAVAILALTASVLIPSSARAATAPADLVVGVAGEGLAVAGGVSSFRVVVRNAGGADASGPLDVALSAF